MIKRFIALLICSVFLFSAVSCAKTTERTFNPFLPDEPEEFDGKLRFNYDGTFKIMFVSDFHSDSWDDSFTMDYIRLFLDVEEPDLVIFGGDNSTDDTVEEHAAIIDILLSAVIERKIPWCHVYGNHDREGTATGDELQQLYIKHDYCLSSDVEELDGTGTYYVPVYGYGSDELKYVVWCLDSHDYDQNGSYYDCVHADQIEWYKKTSEELEKNCGEKVNGMMFCHMPVIELRKCIEDMKGTNFHGTAMESKTPYNSICCSELNYGHFDAIKERGDVQLMLFGHDHKNNFTATLDGITMGYVGSLSGACGLCCIKGTRIVVINENDTSHPETYFGFVEDQYYKFYMDFHRGEVKD